jgi:hypothetical protein
MPGIYGSRDASLYCEPSNSEQRQPCASRSVTRETGSAEKGVILRAIYSTIGCALLAGFGPCSKTPPPAAPAPPPRVDTVVVTKEVPAPLPDGTPAQICLSTGFSLPVLIAASGDTLIGEGRVSIKQTRPGFVFEGGYSEGKPWFASGQPITFEKRSYKKDGEPKSLKCEDLKQVGDNAGVPLFADLAAPPPLETIFVPIQPGVYQAYKTTLPRRR